jgi:octaprenyl-diphosphate synthase
LHSILSIPAVKGWAAHPLASARQYGYRGDAHVKLAALSSSSIRRPCSMTTWSMRELPAAVRRQSAVGQQAQHLVGDFLFSRAFQLMVEVVRPPCSAFSPMRRPSSPKAVLQPFGEKSRHQRSAISERDHGKTAACFGAAGSRRQAAGADPNNRALREYGRNLGIVPVGGRCARLAPAIGPS